MCVVLFWGNKRTVQKNDEKKNLHGVKKNKRKFNVCDGPKILLTGNLHHRTGSITILKITQVFVI